MTDSQDIARIQLLGGRVTLFQPRTGYRAAIDPVLLAASVPARAGDRVLELGCGTGAALLCLGARVPGLHLTGLEIQPLAADLARQGAAASRVDADLTIVEGDLTRPPMEIGLNAYDHVMANPPFWPAGRHTSSPSAHKAGSHGEGAGDQAAFIQAALRHLKSRGTLTLIYPPDRLDHLLGLMAGRFGDICILPLWPRVGVPAKRAIVAGRRDSKGPLTLLPGLVLHMAGQEYHSETDAILRDAAAIPLWG